MSLTSEELRSAIEAILLVAGEPVRVEDLIEALPDSDKEAVESELGAIQRTLEESGAGFILEQTAGGYRFATRPANEPFLRKFFARPREGRLSIAALETLSIIAYRQPITSPEIGDIRGVNSTGVLRTLLEKKMIRIAGRKSVVGSPFLYRTSREFLLHFGLNSVQDLPRLEEFADILGDNISEELLEGTSGEDQVIDDSVSETGEQVDTLVKSSASMAETDDDAWPIGSERRSDEGLERLHDHSAEENERQRKPGNVINDKEHPVSITDDTNLTNDKEAAGFRGSERTSERASKGSSPTADNPGTGSKNEGDEYEPAEKTVEFISNDHD